MTYENCIAVLKGDGEPFEKLSVIVQDPFKDPIITKKLIELNEKKFMDADPHWMPGLFAVFCEDRSKVLHMVKKHNDRAFIDGAYMRDGTLCICFRAGDESESFWKDFASCCGFEFITSYIEEEDDEDEYE